MRDIEIKELFNMPNATLYNFKKKDKSDWRRRIIDFLRAMTKEEAEAIFKRVDVKEDK